MGLETTNYKVYHYTPFETALLPKTNISLGERRFGAIVLRTGLRTHRNFVRSLMLPFQCNIGERRS